MMQVMESFDMFLNGNFVALTKFATTYGVQAPDGKWAIPTRWQSALFQSGQCGAFVGVFLAGPVTNRLGYRWTTILALMMMNATIFISFFVGCFALNARAIAEHYSPTRLRFSPSARPSKACRGASSLPTRPPTPVRLSRLLFVAL